jgi:hypothetical protein
VHIEVRQVTGRVHDSIKPGCRPHQTHQSRPHSKNDAAVELAKLRSEANELDTIAESGEQSALFAGVKKQRAALEILAYPPPLQPVTEVEHFPLPLHLAPAVSEVAIQEEQKISGRNALAPNQA